MDMLIMDRPPSPFKSVSTAHPCPKCAKPDWCSVSADGVWCACRRIGGDGAQEKVDKAGATFYLHRLTQHLANGNGQNAWPAPKFTLADGNGERADPDTLDKVYSALLDKLLLVFMHADALEKRGLKRVRTSGSFAVGFPAGYRTLGKGRAAAVQSLIQAGLEELLPRVPGFFVQEKDGKSYWTLSGWGGLIVPVRDVNGHVIALLVRADEGHRGAKYRYLSSKKRGGAGPGSPAHVPLFAGDTTTIRITEGALKADVATALSGILTVGLPGVGSWRLAAPVLRELGVKVVRLAFDVDCRTNLTVAESLSRLAEHSQGNGFVVELETWPAEAGKGIDDVLAAGRVPDVITGDGVGPAIADIVAAARQASPTELPATSAPDTSAPTKRCSPAPEDDDDPHRLQRYYLKTQAHPDRPKIAFFRQHFWRWGGSRWAELADAEIRGELAAFCKRQMSELFIPTEDDPCMPKVTTALVSNVLQALSGEVLLPQEIPQPAWLVGENPAYRNIIALSNGLLDLDAFFAGQERVLLPHTPLWFSPVALPYSFNPEVDCPGWRAFLDRNLEADKERIALLQEMFGLFLLPDTSRQKFFVLEGEGGNGKSVACAALEASLGRQNCSHVPLEVFGERFQLTASLGKLANISSEVGEIDKAAEGFLKSFTSGDAMQFDRKHRAPIQALPSARLLLAVNNRPRFSDRSAGLWRRMVLIPFRVTIAENDPGRIFGMDKPEWWERSGELPGLLNWSLAGLDRLRRKGGFTRSEICEQALNEYRMENNPARMFLGETCQATPDGQVSCGDLYRKYKQWCHDNGYSPLADRSFGKEVRRVFPKVERREIGGRASRFYAYCGVGTY